MTNLKYLTKRLVVLASVPIYGFALINSNPTLAVSNESVTARAKTLPLRVVVLPFKNTTGQPEDQWLSDSFAETLMMGLLEVKDLRVIERSQIQQLLREQQFGQSAFADEQTAPQIGKMLGADMLVMGSYEKVGSRLRAYVRFVDVETGEIDSRHKGKVEGQAEQVFNLQKQLARHLLTQLQPNTPEPQVTRVQQAMIHTESTKAHQFYIEGLQSLERGDYKNAQVAVKAFQKALIEDPKYPQAHAMLAEAYVSIADLQKAQLILPHSPPQDHIALAERHVRKAIALKPDISEVYRVAAKIHLFKEDLSEALRMVKTAIHLNPQAHQNFQTYINIKSKKARGFVDPDVILNELEQLGVKSDDPWLQFQLASSMLTQNLMAFVPRYKREDIARLLTSAHRQLPDQPGITLMLSVQELMLGHRDTSKQYLEQAVASSENYPYYRMAIIPMLEGLGQKERALKMAKELSEQNPQSWMFQTPYAELLMRGGRTSEAEKIMNKLQAQLPDNSALLLRRGIQALYYQQAPKQAKAYLLEAQRLNAAQDNEKYSGLRLLAEAHLRLKEYDQAVILFKKSLQDPQINRYTYPKLAETYLGQNKPGAALETYKKFVQVYPGALTLNRYQQQYRYYQLRHALSQQPEDAALLNDIGQVLQLQKKMTEALEYYQRALAQAPEQPVILFNLGALYLEIKQYDLAVEVLKKTTSIEPDYAKAWFNLGLAYKALGDNQKAENAFQKARSLSKNLTP